MGPLGVRGGMGELGDTRLALVSLAAVTNEVASVPSWVCSPRCHLGSAWRRRGSFAPSASSSSAGPCSHLPPSPRHSLSP